MLGANHYNAKNWEQHESGLKKRGGEEFSDSFGSSNGVEELVTGCMYVKTYSVYSPSKNASDL